LTISSRLVLMINPEDIIEYIKNNGSSGSQELTEHFEVSRQALNIHLRRLINDGKLFKTGSTRNARYHISITPKTKTVFASEFKVRGLDEGHIYQCLSLSLNLKTSLRSEVESITHYAFTEMLNNVVDHSDSGKTRVRATLDETKITFEIKDWGKGVFASIAENYSLDNEQDAMIELVKGKATTMPEAHSGEGIFFTSKATDRFVLRSHRIQLEWDRARSDVFVSAPRFTKGTSVYIEIKRDSRLKLADVFSLYAPEKFDFQFQRTTVYVKLFNKEYVSRSEAKRLMHRMDDFRVVELDFSDVGAVGQGFADEVFRVFHNKHPEVKVHAVNSNPAIQAMIRHVQK